MTNKEFDEILEKTNAVVCNREWYERAAKALEQQPNDDCVSRQAILKEIPILWNSKGDKDYCMETLRDFVTELPPVTPTQKVGKWENGNPICPCCGEDKFKDLVADIWADWRPKYCPNCGSFMEVER